MNFVALYDSVIYWWNFVLILPLNQIFDDIVAYTIFLFNKNIQYIFFTFRCVEIPELSSISMSLLLKS